MADPTPTAPAAARTEPVKDDKAPQPVTEPEKPAEVPAPTPEPEKAPESTPEPPAADPAPTEKGEEQFVKRLENALEKVEKTNAELKRAVELQVDLVQQNPEFIHSIAQKDPVMADKVILEVWGGEGIRSYKQLMERVNLEKIKETNPELYEVKKETAETKAKLSEIEEREMKKVRVAFLKSKKILDNTYDPNFRKLEDALLTLNPVFVSERYDEALEMAYKIAFMDAPPIAAKVEPQTVTVGGGAAPSPLPPSKAPVSEQTSWMADTFKKKFGYKMEGL